MESFLHSSTTFYHKTIDLLGNYIYFNDLYLATFNFSKIVKRGENCLSLVHEDDLKIVENCLKKLISKELETCTIKIRKKNSTTTFIWTEWEYSTILNNNNEIVSFNCVGIKKLNTNEDRSLINEQDIEDSNAQEQLKNLTNNIKGVLTQFKSDKDLNISWEYLSKGVEEIYEMDFEYIKKNQKKFEALIDQSDLIKTKSDFKKAIKNKSTFKSQYRITTPSGILKWVEVNSHPVENHDKTITWFGFDIDITEKKKIELKNIKIQTTLKNLTNNLNGVVSIFKVLPDGINYNWEYLSKGVENLYEVSLDYVKEHPDCITKMIHPDFIEETIDKVRASIKTLTPLSHLRKIITPSGVEKWIEVNSIPEIQTDGSCFFHGYHVDVTLRKKLEIEQDKNAKIIIENEKFLKNLTDNFDGVWALMKYDNNKTPLWNFASKGVEKLFEVTFNDLKEDPYLVRKMIVENDFEKIVSQIEAYINQKNEFYSQYKIKTPSGVEKWIETKSVVKTDEDQNDVFFVFHQDITSIKKLEIENQKNQELLKNLTNNLEGALTQFRLYQDGSRRWEYMSSGIERIYEFTFEEIQKNPYLIREMASKADLQHMILKLEESREKLTPYTLQIKITTKSGQQKWVEINSIPQKQPDNSVIFHGYHQEITKIKKLEIEARINKQKIIDNADFITNLTNNINGMLTQARVFNTNHFEMEFVSKGIEYIYEITAEEFKKDKLALQKTLFPEYDEIVTQTMNKANETNLPLNMVYQIKTKTGKQKWVEVNSYPKKASDGSVIWYGFHLDVTEKKNLEFAKKKSELKIIESQRFLKNITDNVQGMLTMARIDSFDGYTLEFVSKGMESLYDMSHKEFKKDKSAFFNMVNPVDLKAVKAKMEHCIKTITPMFLQYRIVSPLGRKKWIEVSSYPHKQADETVIWYGFHSDITETKKLEIENLINEEKLKFIVDNASSSIIMFENNKVSFISSNYQKIFGFTVAEETHRLNTYIWDMIADDDENKLSIKTQLHLAIKKQQKQLTIQYKYRHKNGNLIWRKDEISFFYDEKGRVLKAVELASDITEKKNLENLVLNQNLQLALQIEENEKISENFLAFQRDKWLEISQNLHDNISQLLFAANLHLNNFNSKDQSLTKANGLIKMALDEIKFVTESTKNLLIQNKGLENALAELVENNNYLKNISITNKIHPDFCKRFSNSEQIILFTIIQEAMQNAIKHSEGTTIEIILNVKNGRYFVSIKDNGVGLKQNFTHGMGVYNIEKNVSLLNGTIKYLNKNGLELLIEFS